MEAILGWRTPHCALTKFAGRPHWRERRGAFASTHVAIDADQCFAAPISPAITHFDNDATPDSLPLWREGLACTYIQPDIQPEAFARCGVNRALSDP